MSSDVVLITGAGGVVGTALAQYIEERGKYERVECIRSRSDCDLESYAAAESVIRFLKPKHVYHLAGAVFGVGGNLKFPGDVYRRNIAINTNVVEACRIAGVEKIVAMGSVAIYADKSDGAFTESEALIGQPHGSEEAYGFAKRAMLMQLQAYEAQYNLKFCFAISTNLYGPNDRFDARYGHVVPSLVKKFDDASRNKTAVSVWGDGSPTRDFLYSVDAACGLEALMDKGLGAYNLASGRSQAIRDLVEAVSAEYRDVKIEWDRSKPLGQLTRSYDVTRLTGLGFAPKFSLEDGIRRTVSWYRENRDALRGYASPVP